MSSLKWYLLDREGEWARHDAVTEIGTYVMFTNEKEGVYEAYFHSVDGDVSQLYDSYDLKEATNAAQAHHNDNLEATT
jgi:hypothetical protein